MSLNFIDLDLTWPWPCVTLPPGQRHGAPTAAQPCHRLLPGPLRPAPLQGQEAAACIRALTSSAWRHRDVISRTSYAPPLKRQETASCLRSLTSYWRYQHDVTRSAPLPSKSKKQRFPFVLWSHRHVISIASSAWRYQHDVILSAKRPFKSKKHRSTFVLWRHRVTIIVTMNIMSSWHVQYDIIMTLKTWCHRDIARMTSSAWRHAPPRHLLSPISYNDVISMTQRRQRILRHWRGSSEDSSI